jgi:hypothetical protein
MAASDRMWRKMVGEDTSNPVPQSMGPPDFHANTFNIFLTSLKFPINISPLYGL